MQRLYLGSQAAVINRRTWNPKSLRRGQRIITQNTKAIFPAGIIIDEYIKGAKNFAKRSYGDRDERLTGETNIVPIQGSQFMIAATDTARRSLAQMRAAKTLHLMPRLNAVERVVEQELGMLPEQIRTAIRASNRAAQQTLPTPNH